MADVIVQPEAPVQNSYGVIQGLLQFLHDNLVWIVAILIIIILGIIIYYLFMKAEEANKERDDPGYALYKNTIRTARLRADKERIKKTYSMMNLLWLGLPLKWNEHSARILNFENKLIGYYRGHYEGMDNCLNILCYKDKFLIFFEQEFLIKVPLILKLYEDIEIETKNSEGRKVVRKQRQPRFIPLDTMLQYWKNGTIKIEATDVERVGLYYYCPVFIIDRDRSKLDYRKVMEGAIVDQTYQVMLQRVATEGMKTMEKMPSFNPYVQFNQKSPQKTKEEQRVEDTEGGQ